MRRGRFVGESAQRASDLTHVFACGYRPHTHPHAPPYDTLLYRWSCWWCAWRCLKTFCPDKGPQVLVVARLGCPCSVACVFNHPPPLIPLHPTIIHTRAQATTMRPTTTIRRRDSRSRRGGALVLAAAALLVGWQAPEAQVCTR